MKKVWISIFIMIFLILCITLGIVHWKSSNPKNEELDKNVLHDLTMQCINVEEVTRKMNNDTEGEAELLVTLPDFAEIYIDAIDEGDTEDEVAQYVKHVLERKKFDTVSRSITATIVVEDGKATVNEDDAINAVLEKELVEAIIKAAAEEK